MPQITIGPSALPISNPGAKDIQGQNNGQGVLYLSTEQNVSPSTYHALVGPGGSFTWPANEALYACTDPGTTTLLTYLVNGATVDSGSQLAQASNQPYLLFNDTAQVPNTAGGGSVLSAPNNGTYWDVSQYASLIVSIQSLAGPIVPDVTQWLSAQINQLDSLTPPSELPSPQVVDYTLAEWLLLNANGTDVMFLHVPVVGHYAQFFIDYNNGAGTPGPVTAYVFGSYQSLEKKFYRNGNGLLLPGKPSGVIPSIATSAAGSTSKWIESDNDEANLVAVKNSSTSTGYMIAELTMGNSGALSNFIGFVSSPLAAEATSNSQPVNLPMRPLQLTLVNNGTAQAGLAILN